MPGKWKWAPAVTEIRLHGRGGQGIVVAAAIFAEAVFREGRYARAFSLFGAERRGAPVTAFIRVSESRLMPRCRIYEPDYVASASNSPGTEIISGLKSNGVVLCASSAMAQSVGREPAAPCSWRIFAVEAREISTALNLIIAGLPMVNTTLVGALARVSGFASPRSLKEAAQRRLSHRVEDNITAMLEGYRQVREVSTGV